VGADDDAIAVAEVQQAQVPLDELPDVPSQLVGNLGVARNPLVSDPLKEPQQAVAVLDQLPVQPLQEVQQVAVAPLRAHCEHPPLAVADNPEFH